MKHRFERYCKDYENIENYEKALADNFKGWDCHHRREAEFSRKELIALGMYYNVSSEELIFLPSSEHRALHKKGKTYHLGKPHTEEAKKKMSAAKKGKPSPNKGKHLSAETRKKISEAKKGNTATKGMRWFNNGKINKLCYECPDGFTPGRLRK